VGVPTTNINVELMLSRAPVMDAAAPTGSILTEAADGTVWVNMPDNVRSDVTITKQVTCLYDFPLVGVTLEVTPLNQPLAYMDQVVFSIPMTHLEGDTYQGVVPARLLNEDLKLMVVADCWGRQENGVSFIHVYDPVGRIFDQRSGRSVAGARLTLYQVPGWEPKTGPDDNRPNTCQSELSKAPSDPWSQPAPLNLGVVASPEMSGIAPGSPVQKTSVSGYYGWTFGPGCYYFKVEAQFYQTQFTPVVGMPLLSSSLDLTLARDGEQLFLPMLRTR
jgi:hypothetical protein